MILDSFAWIELFIGSDKGKIVEKKITEAVDCFTSIISLGEISEWCMKNGKNTEERIGIIKKYSVVIELNESIAILAGKINFEHKKSIKNWGMCDSIIYATAKFYNLQVLTGDRHFQNLDGVVML